MKAKLILAGLLILALGAFWWLWNYGFVEVTVTNSTAGQIEYNLARLGGSDKSFASTDVSIRKLVRKGSYDISVRQGSSSYFTSIETKGFLRNTGVEASLGSEKLRSFVGDNPAACMNLVADLLVSWQCLGDIESSFTHLAATGTSASSTSSLSVLGLSGLSVQDILYLDSGAFALATAEMHEGDSILGLFPLDAENGTVNRGEGIRLLEDLQPGDTFGVIHTSGEDDFIVYSHAGGEIYKFDSARDDNPEKSSLTNIDSDLQLYSLGSRNNDLLAVFSSSLLTELSGSSFFPSFAEAADDGDEDEVFVEEGVVSESVVVIVSGGQEQRFEFDFTADQTRLCGEGTLCMLKDGVMGVYSMNGDSTDKLYEVGDVVQIESSGDNLLLVKSDGVVAFNPETRSGYYQYSFGGYSYCGLRILGSQYLLCVNNETNAPRAQSVLLIDQGQRIQDTIDQQVFELAALPQIQVVAPYKQFVHISGNYGGLVLQSDGGLGYSPSIMTSVNRTINQKINELGIDRDRYTIVNPFDR